MEYFKLEIGAFYFDGKGVLFSGLSCNGLFYWDIAKNKTYILGIFDKDPIWKNWMSYIAVRRKNIFFFLPFMAHGIPYFNIDTKEIRYCNIPSTLDNKILNYYDFVEKNGIIYIFPVCLLEDILMIDMEQKRVIGIVSEWNKKFINDYKIKKEQFMNGFTYQEEKIWISYNLAKGIFELELNSWKTHFHQWKEINHPIVLQTNDDGLWIEDQGEASVYHISSSGDIIECYRLKTKSKQILFSKVIKLRNDMRIILPNFANVLIIIDNKKYMHCLLIDKKTDEVEGKYLCYYYLEFDDEVWLMPHSQNDIIIVNLKDYSLRFKKLPEPDGWSQICSSILKMRWCESRSVMQENLDNITLKDFCNYVCGKRETIIQKDMMKNYGLKIWREANK